MDSARWGERRWSIRLAGASMVLLAASGTLKVGAQPPSRPDAPPRAQAYTAAAGSESAAATRLVTTTTSPPTTAPPPAAPAVDAQAAIPTRVLVPRVGIDAPIIPLGLDASGALEAPADTGDAGWFAEGPEPGELGPAVIAGHLDSLTGPAIFYRVRELAAGDVIVVERADGSRVQFIVSRIEEHAKAAFPTDAVYGPTTGSELRLITCGGAFNRRTGHYLANVIVFAQRSPEPPAP